jgi:hypothetical protein
MQYQDLVKRSKLEDIAGYACFLSFRRLPTEPVIKTCHLAEQSIRSVLNTEDNARRLLAWHRPNVPSPVTVDMTRTASVIKV